MGIAVPQKPHLMAKSKTLPEEAIVSKIHLFRGQKVMIDRDLAELYGVETKRLKEQVNRNLNRFPTHFMFELTKDEYATLRSQNATLNQGLTPNICHMLLQSTAC